MKSILLLSATAGAGHVRAAEALAETARQSRLRVAMHHHDILDFTFPLFKKLYSEFYFSVVKTSPELWGYFYKRSESRPHSKTKPPLLKLFDHFNYKKYLRAIDRWKPDAILCTHFLPYLAIAEELQRSSWGIPVFSVTTDYDIHSLWISRSVTRYYAATAEAAWTLRSHNIPEDRILVTGIPVMPEFGKRTRRGPARKEFGLQHNAFTVLLLSGGYGIGEMDRMVSSIADFASGQKKKLELLVVCGKNEKLHHTLKRMRFPARVGVQLFQYVPFIDRLMDCADVLITKAGGLTVSEALAKHLPMILFDPIPGQEGRNADYLCEHGAAVRASNLSNLDFKLRQLIEHRSLLAAMKEDAGRIASPDAAGRILRDVLRQL